MLQNLKSRISRLQQLLDRHLLQPLITLSKRLKIPYAGGARVYDVVTLFQRSLSFGDFDLRAYAIAYNFFMALVPALLLLYALIPFLPIPNLEVQLNAYISKTLPPDSVSVFQKVVHNTFESSNIGILSFTTVTVLIFIRRALLVIIKSFTKAEDELFKNRGFVAQELAVVRLFFTILGVFLLSLALNSVAKFLLDHLLESVGTSARVTVFFLKTLSYFLGFFTLVIGVSLIYRMAPAIYKKWMLVNPGGVVAGILLFIAQLLLNTFFEFYARYDRIFGSMTAIVVLMLWLYWQSIVLLLGFELNLSIRKAKHLQEKPSEITE